MSEEVSNTQILQAVTELSGEVKMLSNKVDGLEVRLSETEANLNTRIDKVEKSLNAKIATLDVKIDNVEKRLEQKISANGEKIDRFDDKLSIVTDELLSTKADVKRLKKVQ